LARVELLHDLFARQAQARPRQIAVQFDGELMSYGELDRESNRLARLLRERGAGHGGCVGLWMPRSTGLYVALLAILKSGAAYVPIDPAHPPERVGFILGDCQARLLVSIKALAAKAPSFDGQIVALDEAASEIARQPGHTLDRVENPATPEDLCYIIYTSGSTGKPKGVQIEHRSVCHLVRAEGRIFQVRPEDRVYQGFSIAFDASVEEVWLAFFAGATLVAGTPEMQRTGAGLSRLLAEAGVTVLSCVPTLLAMLEEDIPSVRLLILGGEVCPPDLVQRWWKPTRRLFNTYGPTEATVVATYTECDPARPVTIGRPLPNYFVTILDEQMRPVPPGTPGQLCIGGIGLARGYVGRPELTREKFFEEGGQRRLYQTGDLACWTAEGEIQFLGRLDSQVKIRGFRVELSEIEAVMLQGQGVQAAAAAVREDAPGQQQLVGYLVPHNGARIDEEALRTRLRAALPPYMVPALFETLPGLPTLPSGKVDRKNLPLPRSRSSQGSRPIVPPRTPLERQLAEVWQRFFAPQPVSIHDDFFLDLGGHSLLAARMVSEIRRRPPMQALSVLDVYQNPTIEALAKKLERPDQRGSTPSSATGSPPAAEQEGSPFWRHFFCGAAQLVSLFFLLSFFAVQWLAPYLAYTILTEEGYSFVPALAGACASLVLLYPVMLLVPVAVKWLVVGRYRPGSHPLWGTYYFRWWLATMVEAAVPVGYLTGTPLLSIYLRLMGAKVGKDVHLGCDGFAIYDLLEIGAGSSINADSNLLGYTIEHGRLWLGRIRLGRNCFVGTRSAVCLDTAMEDESALEDLSMLPRGRTIPRGQTWRGSPAAKRTSASGAERGLPADGQAPTSVLRRVAFGVLHGAGLLVIPVLVSAAIFPGIVVMNELNYLDPYYWYLLLAPLVGLSFVVLLCLEIVGLKWLVLGRAKPGRCAILSLSYFRKWFFDKTMELSFDVLGPIYASIYLGPWYRLLGARLGEGAEVSTASFISPDLLEIGEESFIADAVSLGAARVRDGYMTVGRNQIGRRSFIGNSAMLPPGTVIGESVLIGCLSAPPLDPAEALRRDTAWLGSPAIFLPQRQTSAAFPESATFHPSARLRILRAAIEFVRVISPSTCFIILISLLFSALLLLHDYLSMGEALLFFPFLYVGCGLAAALITIGTKWVLVGRYRPCERPLWSTFVWRNELLNALHEHLAEPFLVGALSGTPFLCWYFRALGARIGRRVYMETTDFSEFDLASIGDEAALNADCTIQTHLFEDRVMKMDRIDVAPQGKVGAGSLVLYDTRMETGAALGDLSLLMKGEVLPAGTAWEGVPARRRVEAS